MRGRCVNIALPLFLNTHKWHKTRIPVVKLIVLHTKFQQCLIKKWEKMNSEWSILKKNDLFTFLLISTSIIFQAHSHFIVWILFSVFLDTLKTRKCLFSLFLYINWYLFTNCIISCTCSTDIRLMNPLLNFQYFASVQHWISTSVNLTGLHS